MASSASLLHQVVYRVRSIVHNGQNMFSTAHVTLRCYFSFKDVSEHDGGGVGVNVCIVSERCVYKLVVITVSSLL